MNFHQINLNNLDNLNNNNYNTSGSISRSYNSPYITHTNSEESIEINNILEQSSTSSSSSSLPSTLSSSLSSSPSITLFYEVGFKCSSDIFMSNESYSYGDMVIVLTDNGFNVGFIFREFIPSVEEFPKLHEDGTLFQARKILSKLSDDDHTITNMLIKKIEAENFALNQCVVHMSGRKIGTLAEIIGTEFQFDRKKLTIYIQFQGDVSVCRLVRKLYDIFKVRVKVIDIHNPHLLYNRTMKYLHASKLDVPFSNIYKKESLQNIRSEFRLKKAQLALQNNTQSNQHYFNPPVNRSPLQSPSPTPVPAPTPQVLSHQYSQRSTKMNFNKNHQQNERYSSIPHYPLNSNNLNNSTQNYDSSNVTVFESTFQSLPHRLENIHSNVNYHNSNNQHYSQSQYSNHKDFQTQFHPPIPPHTHQQYSSHQPFPTHPTPPTRNSYPLYSKMNFFS